MRKVKDCCWPPQIILCVLKSGECSLWAIEGRKKHGQHIFLVICLFNSCYTSKWAEFWSDCEEKRVENLSQLTIIIRWSPWHLMAISDIEFKYYFYYDMEFVFSSSRLQHIKANWKIVLMRDELDDVDTIVGIELCFRFLYTILKLNFHNNFNSNGKIPQSSFFVFVLYCVHNSRFVMIKLSNILTSSEQWALCFVHAKAMYRRNVLNEIENLECSLFMPKCTLSFLLRSFKNLLKRITRLKLRHFWNISNTPMLVSICPHSNNTPYKTMDSKFEW